MKTTIQRLGLAALLATTVITTSATDLNVPVDYATIQAAVDAVVVPAANNQQFFRLAKP